MNIILYNENGDNMTIKHPFPRKTYKKRKTSLSNLGMTLEADVEETNLFYLETKRAVIHKKPTPIQVVNVSYPSRNKAKIVEAYYRTPSTTDFNGIYKGYYIDFDCKETNSATSIPLANVHDHQVQHLKNITDAGGIGFLIIYFKQHDEHYLLPFDVLYEYYLNSLKGGRKSIPYSTFTKRAHIINFSFNPRLDYLSVLDEFVLPKLEEDWSSTSGIICLNAG